MEAKILNPEVLKSLSHNHGVFACTCYNTPEKFADKVGKSYEWQSLRIREVQVDRY